MDGIPGYDGWKLATPWDDEREITIRFSCKDCEADNEESTVVGRSMEWELDCSACGERNDGCAAD